MVTDRSFWRGKRVFVTGHTGFKGGWLSLWLQQLGAQVYGYSLPPPTEPSLYSLARIRDGMADEAIADIRHSDLLKTALRHARPEIVVHMAAQAIVLRSYDDPVETFSTNVVGTVTLLDALHQVDSLRAVVVVTSDKCYDNREWLWGYRERDALGGDDPYSASKGATELAVAAMRRSYFSQGAAAARQVGIASARAGNVIGGGDWAAHRLIPDLMRALLDCRACVIRHPESIRPWQHVMEPLAGYLRLAEALWQDGPRYAGGWNFGPPDAEVRSVRWVADELQRQWRGARDWTLACEPGPPENHHLRLDTCKARALLGWAPAWPLPTALHAIVEWYQAYQSGADMHETTHRQISRFEAGTQPSTVAAQAHDGRPRELVEDR